MKIKFIPVLFFLLTCLTCCEEKIVAANHVSETFYVENKGASMHVLVEGNTSSRVFLVFVHGGPGSSSLIYHTDYISEHLENNYAMVYWDQRNSGASQGNSTAKRLNLAQMTDDLKKVIEVIKARYGQDSVVFVLGHSFGGLLTSAFMTTGDNQQMVKGWIFVDGSHNYPLNDTLTREMLMTVGAEQIALGKHADDWNPILTWCQNHPGNFTLDESDQLVDYASDAETFMDETRKIDIFAFSALNAIKYNWPLTSMFFNYLYLIGGDFNADLLNADYSAGLKNVTIPTLVLFGQYDFVCPPSLERDFFNRLGSPDKRMAISPVSGHEMMFQDEAFFCSEISGFLENHK